MYVILPKIHHTKYTHFPFVRPLISYEISTKFWEKTIITTIS